MDKKELMNAWRRNVRHACLCTTMVVLFLCGFPPAQGMDFTLKPSLEVREEYNDNIYLEPNKTGGLITYISPGISLGYNTSFLDLNADYFFGYYYYGKQEMQDDIAHTLHARALARVIKNIFFVELRDDYVRVSQLLAVDYSRQSGFVNQVDQNTVTVNPFLQLKTSATSTTRIGYLLQDTHYKDGAGVNRVDLVAYGDASIDLSSRLTFTTGVRYTRDQNSLEDYNQFEVFAGPSYAYKPDSRIYGLAGETRFDFARSEAIRSWTPFWIAGINHRLFSTIGVSFESRRFFVQDPEHAVTSEDIMTATITGAFQRSTLSISGSIADFTDVQTNNEYAASTLVLGSYLHKVTSLTNGILSASFQEVEDKGRVYFDGVRFGMTRIFTAGLRIDYKVTPKATLSGEYAYADSWSAGILRNNYVNNRSMITFRKVF
ncbi:MAG: TIGR03016 family PEP-CTERM system-associated outer membrane protein [Nitrospirota bacterium]